MSISAGQTIKTFNFILSSSLKQRFEDKDGDKNIIFKTKTKGLTHNLFVST